jgi:hypothetical protein
MSCWVAPSLAADIWQIPLDQLLEKIRSGEVPVRHEDGFTFVDVAPYGPRVQRPNLPPEERPETFTLATDAVEDEPEIEVEVEAVAEAEAVSEDEVAALGDAADFLIRPTVATSEGELGPEDETASKTLGDWRSARRKTARTRIPPPSRRKLSA